MNEDQDVRGREYGPANEPLAPAAQPDEQTGELASREEPSATTGPSTDASPDPTPHAGGGSGAQPGAPAWPPAQPGPAAWPPTQPQQPGRPSSEPGWPSAGSQPAWPPQQPPAWPPQQPPAWPPQQPPAWPPQQPPAWPPQQPSAWPPASVAPAWPETPPERPGLLRRSSGPVLAIVAAALIAFGGGILVGRTLIPAATPSGGSGAPSASLSGFGVYQEALDLVKSHYVNRGQIDDKTLVYGSIAGMIDALGDTGHSRFLTPDQYKAYQQSLQAQITGIGVVGGDLNGSPSIVRVLAGSPADKAGLKAGDQIVAVDGTDVTGMTFDQIASKIRGPAGTTVTISVLHLNEANPVEVKITRAVISVPLVDWSMVPGTKIADIVLTGFDQGASKQLRDAISAAQAKGATSIILDLRGNPGGYVSEAINVASIFLSSGNVYTEVDETGKKTEVPIDTKAEHISLPLVVLIDNNSASAAEIVSGAIKDAHRAKLVGVRTFGTGTVLRPYELSDGSAIYLGVSKFLTPSGQQIFGNGISPDEEVSLPLGTAPLDASALQTMTAAQFEAIKDAQLLAAAKALR